MWWKGLQGQGLGSEPLLGGTKVGFKEENRYDMNMLVVNGQLYSRSTGARSTTLVPVFQKSNFYQTPKNTHLSPQ